MSAMFEVFTAWKLAHTRNHVGFPGGLDGRESTCNAGDLGLIPGLGRSLGERKGYPLQYSDLENPTDSPWCRKSRTEQLSLSLYGILTHPPQEKHFAEYYKMLSFQKEGKQSKDNIRK